MSHPIHSGRLAHPCRAAQTHRAVDLRAPPKAAQGRAWWRPRIRAQTSRQSRAQMPGDLALRCSRSRTSCLDPYVVELLVKCIKNGGEMLKRKCLNLQTDGMSYILGFKQTRRLFALRFALNGLWPLVAGKKNTLPAGLCCCLCATHTALWCHRI